MTSTLFVERRNVKIFLKLFSVFTDHSTDIISYVGRDLEDAQEIHLLEDLSQVPRISKNVLGKSNRAIIDNLVKDVIKHSYKEGKIKYSSKVHKALRKLKNFNEEYIYANPKVKMDRPKVKRIYEMLFDKFLDDIQEENKKSKIYKHFLEDVNRMYLEEQSPAEKVRDFIAGMTDEYFISTFKNIEVQKLCPLRLMWYILKLDFWDFNRMKIDEF